ncbi:hypothetical protein [Microbacterium tenebrionis]|uniref:hypothetical protein n=1 Tax=Microbacterium tenebrionis TaxID=2830665 RepID=UPI00158A69E1|nr:hypothetical protein [Microbacterium ihumii]
MSARGRELDGISMPPAVPGAVLHVLLPVVAAAAAQTGVDIIGWRIAVLVFAVLGMLFPQTLGGWLSIGCLAVGMLLGEPDVAVTMLMVLFVHLMHVLSALLPVVPWRGRVVLSALRPTVRRLLLGQLIIQPVTLGVMLVQQADGTVIGGAVLLGAAAVVGIVALFAPSVRGRS